MHLTTLAFLFPVFIYKCGMSFIGHQRELSETSSGGSDDSHCSEVEKLLKVR